MKNRSQILLVLLAAVAFGTNQAPGQYPWTKDSRNPILSGGGSGAWDADVSAPCVIFNSDSARFEMWYTGSLPSGQIGFAVSSDGITWSRSSNPVLSPSPGTWDSYFAGVPCVIRENHQYKMWYTGAQSKTGSIGVGDGRIGFATSPDGRNWTKLAGNPVLTVGASVWESGAVAFGSVVKSAGGYLMFYTGSPSGANQCLIGRATSLDGITWQKDTLHNPVLNLGGAGAWDSNIYLPTVLTLGGKYYMWYTAETVPGDGASRIGLAGSADSGKTWAKFTQNPVLIMGTSGTWEATGIELGSVLLVGATLHMWYDAWAPPGYLSRVGHATSPLTGIAEEAKGLSQRFILSQNYPNPFNPATVIGYQVPCAGNVTLAVYDLLGREVAVLVNERKAPGRYEVQFDASRLSSGVYLYRLTGGSFVQSQKMVLIR